VKLRSRASCQLDARSEARPEAVVRVRNWEVAIWRFALAISSSMDEAGRSASSVSMAEVRVSRFSGDVSAEMAKRPSSSGPFHVHAEISRASSRLSRRERWSLEERPRPRMAARTS
jgi:hypothetical protein